jgi:hypothetical protein
MGDDRDFHSLEGFLTRVPAIQAPIGKGRDDKGRWWMKFGIDTQHALAWTVVQELGHVLNYLSINERLPTRSCPYHRRLTSTADPGNSCRGSLNAMTQRSSPER